MGALKAQKRGAPPFFSSSRRKPISKMAATSSNSLGQENTLSEMIKEYKIGQFEINPCDVLVQPLVRPLKEFGVRRLVESFKSKGNMDTSMICVVERDDEEQCSRTYLIVEGAHRTTALQRIIKEYEDKGQTPPEWCLHVKVNVYKWSIPRILMMAYARAANQSHSDYIADSVLDRLFYLKAAADTARNNPIATIKVFKHNGHINAKGLAAYLKATNSVELTDAGIREITLLSYLQDEDMAHLEKLCSESEAQSKALSMYYVMKVIKADPFFCTVERRRVLFTRVAVSRTKHSRVGDTRSGEKALSELCKAVSTALTFIRDYRARRNEMIMKIDPESLLSDEHKAESSDETKLFTNAEKGEYDDQLKDYRNGSEFPQTFETRFRITKSELEGHVNQLVLDKEAAEEAAEEAADEEAVEEADEDADVETVDSCAFLESSTLSDDEDTNRDSTFEDTNTEATETTDAVQPRRSSRKRKQTPKSTDSGASANRFRSKRKQRRVNPGVEEQEAISPEMIIARAEVWIQPETFEQFRAKNGADYIRVKHQTSLVIIDPVYTSAFVSNDAKYWFRAASELLKEDEPGTLLVYTPWHMASVWNSALESLGEEVELKLEPTPMYVIEKPDGLPNAGNSSEQYDAVTMVLVAHRTGQAVPLCRDPPTELFGRSHGWMPPTSNVLTNNQKRAPNTMIKSGGHAVFPALQRSFNTTSALIQRYTKGREGEGMGEHVVELSDSGVCSASVPCLVLGRRYVGFSPDAHEGVNGILKQTILRRTRSGNSVSYDFGGMLPGCMEDLVGSSTPPEYLADEKYQKLKTPFDKAQYDAEVYGCEIKKSLIVDAGWGLFASEAKKEGDTLGYYWGKVYFLDDVPAEKNTGRYMMTTKYLQAKEGDVEGERRFMHIDGVLACAAGYVNDPALVGYKANAAFQELDLLPCTVENEVNPPIWSLIILVATKDISANEEIYTNYSGSYVCHAETSIWC